MRILSFCCIISFIFNGRLAKAKVLFRKTSEMRNWSIPEKIQTGRRAEGWVDWGHTFLKKTSGTFRFVTLPLDIPDKMTLHPWKFHKIVLHPLGFPRPKTKTHENSTQPFLDHLWKFHILKPPCLIFFWSSQLLCRWRLCKSFVLRWNDCDQFQTVKFKFAGSSCLHGVFFVCFLFCFKVTDQIKYSINESLITLDIGQWILILKSNASLEYIKCFR